MTIDRRKLIQGAAGVAGLTVAAGAGLPQTAAAEAIPIQNNEREREWGLAIVWSEADGIDVERARQALIADAELYLPAGTRFQIRERAKTAFGRVRGLAWYRREGFDDVNWSPSDLYIFPPPFERRVAQGVPMFDLANRRIRRGEPIPQYDLRDWYQYHWRV